MLIFALWASGLALLLAVAQLLHLIESRSTGVPRPAQPQLICRACVRFGSASKLLDLDPN